MIVGKIMIDERCIMEACVAFSQRQDSEDLSLECNDAFQELETHFVNVICGGSEQYAWELMNAIAHSVTNRKLCDIEMLMRLRNKAKSNIDNDDYYINYISVLLSMYESMNTDVLVANNQYIISSETINNIINNYEELTTTYSITMYNHTKEVFSSFINTKIISADEAVTILYDYYESSNNLDLDDEDCIRQALAESNHSKALVYFIKVCRDNALDKLEYLKTVKFNGV